MAFRDTAKTKEREADSGDGGEEDQPQLKIELPATTKVKSHARRLNGIQQQLDELRQKAREAWESAKDDGVNKRMLKLALKHQATDAAKVKADREHYDLYAEALGVNKAIAELDEAEAAS